MAQQKLPERIGQRVTFVSEPEKAGLGTGVWVTEVKL
jgi:hypothetical protein